MERSLQLDKKMSRMRIFKVTMFLKEISEWLINKSYWKWDQH